MSMKNWPVKRARKIQRVVRIPHSFSLCAGPWTLALLVFVMLGLSPGSLALAMDRADLGRVLETLPPNGPFWKYGNVTMQSKSRPAGMVPVVFPHWVHRARYSCKVCHDELGFSMRAGWTGVTRTQYLAGAYCGACHNGTIAFSPRDEDGACVRCHFSELTELKKRFEAFAAKMPAAPFGNGIDWSRAQREGAIKPISSLQGTAVMPLPDKLKKPLKLGTVSPRSDLLFSHEEHNFELACSNCHPDLFNIQKKGTQAFTMDSNIFGNFCGACHLLVAFPMNDCRRCHPRMRNQSSF